MLGSEVILMQVNKFFDFRLAKSNSMYNPLTYLEHTFSIIITSISKSILKIFKTVILLFVDKTKNVVTNKNDKLNVNVN